MSERPHAPSSRKRRDARAAGRVARSAVLSRAAVVTAGLVALVASATAAADRLLRFSASATRRAFAPTPHLGDALRDAFELVVSLSVPLVATAIAAAFVATYLQVGRLFTVGAAVPDGSRLSPTSRRLREPVAWATLGASILAPCLAALVLLWTADTHLVPLFDAAKRGAGPTVGTLARVARDLFEPALAALLLLGLGDLLWRRHVHHLDLRMSEAERRDELHEQHSDPGIRARRRGRWRSLR